MAYKTVKITVEERGFPFLKWRKTAEYREHNHDFIYKGSPLKVGSIRECECGLTEELFLFTDQYGRKLDTDNSLRFPFPVWLKIKNAK